MSPTRDAATAEGTLRESIAVVGGGMTGISAALELAESGRFDVTLFEKNDHLGGLSDFFRWNDVVWDRFYHVILSTDERMLAFLLKLGLEPGLFWQDTRTGFFGKGKLVSMSTTLDFIRFPFMSLLQKLRMAFGILYASRIRDPSRLDRIYLRTWLTTVFGRRVYESIWEPLLRSKLGTAREKTSAVFIWATITRLYGTRKGKHQKERMGHVRGGYRTIVAAAHERLREKNVTVRISSPVSSVRHLTDGSPGALEVAFCGEIRRFDRVLFTCDCQSVLDAVGPQEKEEYWARMRQVNYLGIACAMIILDRKLSPYYVINLLDKSLPFTGVIEATNVVPSADLRGRHLVYLPKYVTSDDPVVSMPDNAVLDSFVAGLKKVFPDLRDEEILHRELFRERFVQPLCELGALDRAIGHETPLEGVYVANSSMIARTTLNNNAAIALAHRAVSALTGRNDTQ